MIFQRGKIDKSLTKKKKTEKAQIKSERGDITTDKTEIRQITDTTVNGEMLTHWTT